MDYSYFSQIMKNIQMQIASDELIQAVRSVSLAQDTLKPVVDNLAKQYANLISGPALDFLRETISNLEPRLQRMATEIPASSDTDMDHEDIAEAIEQAMPYVTDVETSGQCVEHIQQLRSAPHFKWTFDRAVSLLSLLLTLFFGIMSMLSDKQRDEIIANQQQASTESREENDAIVDALYAVRDSIGVVSNEVEALRNESENLNDLPDSQSEPDAPESQDDAADSQN